MRVLIAFLYLGLSSCSAYTLDPEPARDLTAADYLGKCWYDIEHWLSGEWYVVVEGDPAWGDFRYTGFVTLWGSDKQVFPQGFHNIEFWRFDHTLYIDKEVTPPKKIERITGVWCHAFRMKPT